MQLYCPRVTTLARQSIFFFFLSLLRFHFRFHFWAPGGLRRFLRFLLLCSRISLSDLIYPSVTSGHSHYHGCRGRLLLCVGVAGWLRSWGSRSAGASSDRPVWCFAKWPSNSVPPELHFALNRRHIVNCLLTLCKCMHVKCQLEAASSVRFKGWLLRNWGDF